MRANSHFDDKAKSGFSKKQLKKKFIKGIRFSQSNKNKRQINNSIDFCATLLLCISHI
jgi:hypothetical protein